MQLVYVHPSLLGFKQTIGDFEAATLGFKLGSVEKLLYLKQDSWRDLTQMANFIFSTKHEPNNLEFSLNFEPLELALITNCTVNHPLIARGFHNLTSNISFILMGSYNLSFGSTPRPHPVTLLHFCLLHFLVGNPLKPLFILFDPTYHHYLILNDPNSPP